MLGDPLLVPALSQHYDVRQPATATTPLLLDQMATAPRAIYSSAFKLRNAYTGAAFKVRRASDSALLDIGFSGSLVDLAALTAFCTGTNGFVHTWYDNSVNALNVTQTTTTKQPKVYDSVTGPNLTAGGKLAIRFDADDELTRADGFGFTGSPALTAGFAAQWLATGYAWLFGDTATINSRLGLHGDTSSNRIEFQGGGLRIFNSVVGTAGYWIAGKPAADDVDTAGTLEKNGAAQSLHTFQAGTHNMVNTMTTLGFNFQGHMPIWGVWNAVLAGSDLTTLRAGLAAHA